MPYCYQPNDRKRAIAEPLTRNEYGLAEDALVLCCFNQAVKYTPQIFERWMSLLRRLPNAVLWLMDDNPWSTANLGATAQKHGIPGERLVFAPRLAVPQHLARYSVADLALDTYPYGSHTTGSEALYTRMLAGASENP
jgi:predicted O-linked N-acetylglucosamine transferase (SPINDLY family)